MISFVKLCDVFNYGVGLEQLREADIQEIFVLCTRGELIKYRTPELLPLYEEAGFTLHHWPIQDGSVPAMDDLLHLLHDVQVTFFSGAKILIQ